MGSDLFLKLGDSTGREDRIVRWQTFLAGLGCYRGDYSPNFGPRTKAATGEYQASEGLDVDGVVGAQTLRHAVEDGFPIRDDERAYLPAQSSVGDASWPPLLDADGDGRADLVYPNEAERQALWGKFAYEVTADGSTVRVTDNWARDNLVLVDVPQLVGKGTSGHISFHKKAAPQLVRFFQLVEKAGLLDRILSWGGSYSPRLIRGSTTVLSNHAFGVAFDINMQWNGLGVVPALVGQKGSVRELVPFANLCGIFWGGHYRKRLDGMHFEVVRILSPAELP